MAPDDPNRCLSNGGKEQCMESRVPGSNYCIAHGGRNERDRVKAENQRLYRLSKWQNRVNEIADHDKVKSLREEIGILRVLLEEILNKCQSTTDLLLYASKITDIVTRIEKLVVSCNRLETSAGLLLDKNAVLFIGQVIVSVISEEVKDESKIDTISSRILGAIANIGSPMVDKPIPVGEVNLNDL